MSGRDRLRADLDRLDEVLEAFEHPAVDRRPSSRLLEDTLHQRRVAIHDKLAEARRDTLEVRLASAGDVPATLLVAVLGRVLEVVDREVAARLGEDPPPGVVSATTCHVHALEHDADDLVVVLSGPDDPGEVTPRTGDDEHVLGAALRATVDRLDDDGHDDRVALAGVLADGPAVLTLSAAGPDDVDAGREGPSTVVEPAARTG